VNGEEIALLVPVECRQSCRPCTQPFHSRLRPIASSIHFAIRLEPAEQPVMKTDMPLAKIASLAGFANHGHLRRVDASQIHDTERPSASSRRSRSGCEILALGRFA